jgi:hypothetical protein
MYRAFGLLVLALLLAILSPLVVVAQQPIMDEATRNIHSALKKKVNWSFEEKLLSEVVAAWQNELGMTISLDRAALDGANIVPSSTLVTKSLREISARSAIETILRDHGLAWMIRDELLVITTKEEADMTLVARIYPVLDLVQFADDKGEYNDYGSLTETLHAIIEPNTWRETGTGEASIKPFPASGAIIVSQTAGVHEKIERLLTDLRATREAQGIKGRVKRDRPAPEPSAKGFGGGGFGGGGFGGAGQSGQGGTGGFF